MIGGYSILNAFYARVKALYPICFYKSRIIILLFLTKRGLEAFPQCTFPFFQTGNRPPATHFYKISTSQCSKRHIRLHPLTRIQTFQKQKQHVFLNGCCSSVCESRTLAVHEQGLPFGAFGVVLLFVKPHNQLKWTHGGRRERQKKRRRWTSGQNAHNETI